jgi:ubiquinone/menaquinone biosynthesis C-methylase UbiE
MKSSKAASSRTVDRALLDTAALYDRIAPSYQRWWATVIEPAALRLLELVADAVADRPKAVIVDVGAGTGTLARAAVARWPMVRAIALDPSAGMLDIGQAEAARTLDPSARRRLSWLTGAAEHLSIAAGSVDAVVSSFTLQYVRRRGAALREAGRVLRPGGAIAIVTWLASDVPFTPWRLLTEVLAELGLERPPSQETGLFRSLPSAAALVRRAGFRHVHATEGVVEYPWSLDALVHCTMKMEERELIDSLAAKTRRHLERIWRSRLAALTDADFQFRDVVAYVSGRRPA